MSGLESNSAHPSAALRGEPEAAGHGSVEGDVRALRQMVADCDVYLKEGETPAQRIERERRDTEAVLNLLIREKQRTEAMREVIGTLRDLLDMWHGGHLQVRPEAEGAWLAAVQVGETAIARSGQAASGSSQGARSDEQSGAGQPEAPTAAAPEPVAVMLRDGVPRFGIANILVRFEPAADLLPRGQHRLYTHPPARSGAGSEES